MERLVDDLGSHDTNPSPQLLVERLGESLGIGAAVLRKKFHRKVHVNHLGERVHSGVGSSRTHDDWLLTEMKGARQGCPKKPYDRREFRLECEAVQTVAVVGKVESPPLGGDH